MGKAREGPAQVVGGGAHYGESERGSSSGSWGRSTLRGKRERVQLR